MDRLNGGRFIRCLNSGSSSRKFAVYQFGTGAEKLLAEGAAEGVNTKRGRLWIRDGEGRMLADAERTFPAPDTALEALFDEADRLHLPQPDAIGHRFVHGGAEYSAPQRVTPQVLATLRRLVSFAPLHMPSELEGVEAAAKRFSDVPQVICFDTAFHRRMPEVAQRLPLPRAMWDEGLRRYGFHGISYEYIMHVLGGGAPPRIIIAHLGNGASMVAVRDGHPLDTTMGFTPSGGLMMGTRTGDLDPGLLVYLLNAGNYDGHGLERLVNKESGMLGVSAVSGDMKVLLDRSRTDANARQAVEMFCYHARKYIGAFAAVLDGLDLLVFTGGIGERAAAVRGGICRGLGYLGIRLDERRNEAHADVISAAGSDCAVRVIPTNEDLMIARHTHAVVFAAA